MLTSLAVLGGLLIAGCGSGQQKMATPTEVKSTSASQSLKGWLDEVATTGELNSGVTLIPQMIDESAQPKAAELKKDLDDLNGLRDPAKIKAKAKEMSAKIEVKPAM
jgi:outer membrane murein-binding lipoprotein Lpp